MFLHDVALTGERYGPVPVALAHPQDEKDPWLIVSNALTDGRGQHHGRRYQPKDPWLIVSNALTGLQMFPEYGLRFDLEDKFWMTGPMGFSWKSPSSAPPRR